MWHADSLLGGIRFWGGKTTRVAISGDGDTDLDLIVVDERGNVVDSDVSPRDDAYVEWRTPVTRRHRIVVRNLGRVYNDFLIMSN